MARLERFSTPANLDELSEEARSAWSDRIAQMFGDSGISALPQVFNPIGVETAELREHPVPWPAFPATLKTPGRPDAERWEEADSERDKQDEYCEWAVERSGDDIARVAFTTETPDYFQHVLEHDPDLLRSLYEGFVGERPTVEDLTGGGNDLLPENAVNCSIPGRIAHLSQESNNLGAAIKLVGDATVLRESGGVPVTDQNALVDCGGFGIASRNSDPQIAVAVNQLAATGAELSIADPPGLYIDEFLFAGMRAPDEADVTDFWRVTRGDAGHALRAEFAVPAERGYSVSDIEMDGRRIEFGAQLADRVRIRVVALSRPGEHEPVPLPCVGEGG